MKTVTDSEHTRQSSKEDILADIQSTIDEIETHTLPRFEGTVASQLFTSSYKLQSAWTQKRARLYQANVRGAQRQFIEHISKMLGVSLKWLTYLHDAIDEAVDADTVYADGVSYPIKTMLDTYSFLKLHVGISRKLLLAVYSYESDDVEANQPGKPSFPYTRAEIMQLENNFSMYCRIANMLDKNARASLDKIIKDIPDIELDSEGTAYAVYGKAKLEPLTSGITDIHGLPNIIWHIRKWFASMQANRFKAAEAESKMLELRLIKMRREVEGVEDAQLDKSIEYQTKRLTELNYRIHQMEEKYGL